MSKEVMYFVTDCWRVERAGFDVNGNSKFMVYAYNHYANQIIKGVVKAYLHSNVGDNNTDCKIGYVWSNKGEYKIVSVDEQFH